MEMHRFHRTVVNLRLRLRQQAKATECRPLHVLRQGSSDQKLP